LPRRNYERRSDIVVIVVLVLLEAGAIWGLRRWQDAHSLMRPPQLTASTTDAAKLMGSAALTEDDVILFGLALEASNDVVSDLLADSC
jgi:hypothetical protein